MQQVRPRPRCLTRQARQHAAARVRRRVERGLGLVRVGVSRCDVALQPEGFGSVPALQHFGDTGTVQCRAPGPGGQRTRVGRAAEQGARARGRQRAQQDLQATAAGFHAGFRRYALLTPPAWLRAVDGGAVRQVRRRGHGRPAHRPEAVAGRGVPLSPARSRRRAWRPAGGSGGRVCARPGAAGSHVLRGGAAWRARRPAGSPPAGGRRAVGIILLHSWLGRPRRRLTPLRRGRCWTARLWRRWCCWLRSGRRQSRSPASCAIARSRPPLTRRARRTRRAPVWLRGKPPSRKGR